MKKLNVTIILLALLMTGCGSKASTDDVSSAPSEVEVIVTDNNVVGIASINTISEENVSSENESVPEDNDNKEKENVVSSDKEEKNESVASRVEGEPVDLSWFDDCVFIGDSLTNGLGLYNDFTECLGNAQFICGASLGYNNAQWDLFDENAVHPTYNGDLVLLEDAAVLTGANKVIIGMGMNDIGNYGVDGSLEGAESFLERLRSKSPDVDIYLMTVTPMIASAEYDRLNNDKIQEFNSKLAVFAPEHGCHFLNTWEAFADENGKLPDELCLDPEDLGIHLNNEGCEMLKDYIMRNV